MKRLLSSGAAVILCMVLLTIPFSSAPSASSLVENAFQKLNTINSIDYRVTEKRILTVDDEKQEQTQTLRVKVVYKGRNSADIAVNASGSGGKFDIYYKDGYVYQNLYGIKSRTKTGSLPVDPLDDFMLQVPRYLLRNAEVTKTEDGGHKVVARMSSDIVTQAFRESVAATLKDEGHTDIRVGLSDFKTTYNIDKNGNLKSVVNTVSATAITNKGKQTEQYRQTVQINSTDRITSVGFPTDLSSYTTY